MAIVVRGDGQTRCAIRIGQEQIAGFAIIECANLDEATEAAARHPAAAYGTIEIRPFSS